MKSEIVILNVVLYTAKFYLLPANTNTLIVFRNMAFTVIFGRRKNENKMGKLVAYNYMFRHISGHSQVHN
jgi:hypothetical protein